MQADQFYTADGGYVAFELGTDGRPLFACTERTGDLGVRLEHEECLRLGLMLLQSVLTLDEQAVLRAVVSLAEHRLADPVAP